jgi:hypothetical protein
MIEEELGFWKEYCAKCRTNFRRVQPSLGSGKEPYVCGTCSPRPAATRKASRRETTRNITYVSPAPTVADQLVALVKLRKEGSLTEQEFQILKARLISGDKM